MLKTTHRLTGASVQLGGKVKAAVFPTEGSTHHAMASLKVTVRPTGNMRQPVHKIRSMRCLTKRSSHQPMYTLKGTQQILHSNTLQPPGQTQHHSSDQEACPTSTPPRPSQHQHQPMQHWANLWCPSEIHTRKMLQRGLLGCLNTQYSSSQT